MSTPKLSERAMIVRLSISQWTARKYDRKVSARVDQDFNTKRDAGRYNKLILSKEAIDKISKVVGEVRQWHYRVTLPWDDQGGRLLPASGYFDYREQLQKHQSAFYAAVTELEDNYPALVEQARIDLNGMFDEEDYPAQDQIRRKFSVAVDIEPIPERGDFRVGLDEGEIERLTRDLESAGNRRIKAAMDDVWNRAHKALSAVVERLSDPKNIFRDSLIGNVRDLVEVLPTLNITGDEGLALAISEMRHKIAAYDPQEIRDNGGTRAAVCDEARKIMEKMGVFMGETNA